MQFSYAIIAAVTLGASQTYAVTCNPGQFFEGGVCKVCPTEKNAACPGGVDGAAVKKICGSAGSLLGTVVNGNDCQTCAKGNFIKIADATSDDTCVTCSAADALVDDFNFYGPITDEMYTTGDTRAQFQYLDINMKPGSIHPSSYVNNAEYVCPGEANKPIICAPGMKRKGRTECENCENGKLCRIGKEYDIPAGYKIVDYRQKQDNHDGIFVIAANPSDKVFGKCQFETGYPRSSDFDKEQSGEVCTKGVASKCQPGFQANDDSDTCKPCEQGYTCNDGVRSEQPCHAGWKANADRNDCEKCDAMEYCMDGYNTTRSHCPEGKHIYDGICEDCPSKTVNYCNGTHVLQCPAGHTCKNGFDNGACADGSFAKLIETYGSGNDYGVIHRAVNVDGQNELLPGDYELKYVCIPCTGDQVCTAGIMSDSTTMFASVFTVTVGFALSNMF